MDRFRRLSLVVVLLGGLVATGFATTLVKASNPSSLPSGLLLTTNAESTALYCTGLSSTGGLTGHVTFSNTSSNTRNITVQVASDTGKRATQNISLNAYASASLEPSQLVTGNSFGLAAAVDGAGVVGEEVSNDSKAQVPCVSAGVTDWYAGGFDTRVGSSALISVFNPTATPAVINVTLFSGAGYSAPGPLQGRSIGAHAQVELNLGQVAVNIQNVGVHIAALRGSIVVVGVEHSGKVSSLNPGSTTLAASAVLPRVTTVNGAAATIFVANPSAQVAKVTLQVVLSESQYTVAPLTLTVAPFRSGQLVITPNPAIAASGYATINFASTEPVIVTLATGTPLGVSLSPPVTAGREFLLSDFTGKGFGSATVTNEGSSPIEVTLSVVSNATGAPQRSSVQIPKGVTSNIVGLFSIGTLTGATLLITASRPTLVVSATLVTNPLGATIALPLNGG